MVINIEVAQQFGKLIAKADYRAAHVLLTKEAQEIYSPEDFQQSVEQMIDYWSVPIEEVIPQLILKDWPAKQDKDIGIVYIGDHVVNGQKTTLSRKSLSSNDYRLYIFINKIPTLGSKLVFLVNHLLILKGSRHG